jgi:broad specificity phosphatase PhoE
MSGESGLARPIKASAPNASPDAPDRPGAVLLVRHGEPALSRRIRLSAPGYRDWWATYERSGLKMEQEIPKPLAAMAEKAGFVIASTRLRSIQTAQALSAGRAFAEDPLFVEAQLRAEEAARQLVDLAANGQDVLVVAHGFFNAMVGEALKRLGWRCTLDQGFRYWSARRYERA